MKWKIQLQKRWKKNKTLRIEMIEIPSDGMEVGILLQMVVEEGVGVENRWIERHDDEWGEGWEEIVTVGSIDQDWIELN